MAYYKARIGNSIWCETHGIVRIPQNFHKYELGLSVTVDCPHCAFDMCDISIEELESLEYKEREYNDTEFRSNDLTWNFGRG